MGFLVGLANSIADATYMQPANGGNQESNYIGLDSTTVAATPAAQVTSSAGTNNGTNTVRLVADDLAVGFHYFQELESSANSGGWLGPNSLTGTVMM